MFSNGVPADGLRWGDRVSDNWGENEDSGTVDWLRNTNKPFNPFPSQSQPQQPPQRQPNDGFPRYSSDIWTDPSTNWLSGSLSSSHNHQSHIGGHGSQHGGHMGGHVDAFGSHGGHTMTQDETFVYNPFGMAQERAPEDVVPYWEQPAAPLTSLQHDSHRLDFPSHAGQPHQHQAHPSLLPYSSGNHKGHSQHIGHYIPQHLAVSRMPVHDNNPKSEGHSLGIQQSGIIMHGIDSSRNMTGVGAHSLGFVQPLYQSEFNSHSDHANRIDVHRTMIHQRSHHTAPGQLPVPSNAYGVATLTLTNDDSAFLLGRGGTTKKKLERVSGAALELHERHNRLEIHGGIVERRKAHKYVQAVLAQRTGLVRMDFRENVDDDLSVVDVPEAAVAFVTGSKGNFLRTLEEEWNVLLVFVEPAEGGSRHSELLAIYGDHVGRRVAELKVMSAVETKCRGHFTHDFHEGDVGDANFGSTYLKLDDEEISWALGKQGFMKRKLVKASECIIEYIGNWVIMSGTKDQRTRAAEYLRWALADRGGGCSDALRGIVAKHERSDMSIVEVPKECVSFVTGTKRNTLLRMEESWGVLMLFSNKNSQSDFESLAIFGPKKNRQGAEFEVMRTVETKLSGHFSSKLETVDSHHPGWDIDVLELTTAELTSASGREGAMRRRLCSMTTCIMEFIGPKAVIAGTLEQRKNGRRLLQEMLKQRSDRRRDDDRDDLKDDEYQIEGNGRGYGRTEHKQRAMGGRRGYRGRVGPPYGNGSSARRGLSISPSRDPDYRRGGEDGENAHEGESDYSPLVSHPFVKPGKKVQTKRGKRKDEAEFDEKEERKLYQPNRTADTKSSVSISATLTPQDSHSGHNGANTTQPGQPGFTPLQLMIRTPKGDQKIALNPTAATADAPGARRPGGAKR